MPSTAILSELRSVGRKVQVLSVVFGVGVLVASAVIAFFATVLLDYALNLRPVPRLIFMTGAAAFIGYVLFRYVAIPALTRLSVTDVAERLEHVFPQFDDRLRSTVDFATNPVPGSDAMKDRVVTETATLFHQVDLNRAIERRPVYYAIGSGVLALLLGVVILATANPTYRGIAFSRLLHPFDGPRWPKRVQIDVVGAVPGRVPVGQRVDVKMKLGRGDRDSMKAVVLYRTANGPVQQEFMTRQADGTYVASIDARLDPNVANGNLQIAIKSGDDEVRLKPVEIVPRLGIADIQALVTPPKYAQLAPVTVNMATGPAVMAAGSEMQLVVRFNKPLGDAAPDIQPVGAEMAKPDVTWQKQNETTLVGRWHVRDSLRFHLLGRDTDGFANPGLEEYELMVRPDQMPVVQIENPRRNEERTPEAVVPLQVMAEDDYGIASVKLVVDRLGDKAHWEIPLVANAAPAANVGWERADASADRQRNRLKWDWELKQLSADLKPGDLLEYHAVAQDNFDLDGKRHDPVASGKLRIAIISQDQLAARVAEEMQLLAQNLDGVRTGQQRTRQETQALREDTAKKPEFDSGDRAIAERLANQQGTAASQTKQTAGKLDALRKRLEENRSPSNELKQTAADVRDLLNQTAEGPMKDAAAQVGQAKEGKQAADERNKRLDEAMGKQQQSADQLTKALDRMGNVGGLRQAIEQIAALLEAQKNVSKQTAEIGRGNLGKRPEQMSADERKKMDQNAADQKALAERTQKTLEQMQKQSEAMSKSDKQAAQALSQAAKTGQQQQVPSKQQQASQSAKQNQQAQAQNAQKQAEIGLELVLAGLHEAERHKLEELSKQLAELQDQLNRLVRRQAGHNLDNLALQGPDVLRKTETKILEDLILRAERPKEQLANVPAIAQLTSGQEQTERNTRDVGKQADGVQGGAEVAGLLTRAAGKMERAAVVLRENKLPDAYDPPQVEALASLVDAKKRVDQMKEEADKKLQDQTKEAIRQVFEKVKDDQVKLNTETARIDKVQRLPDGSFPRVEAVKVGQLPGQQGQLADRTKELDDRLSALGSVVYVWANKDIRESMNGVKDRLGKPETGAVTQDQQSLIVAQLDAMIRSLAVKPLEKRFEDRNNGGGGGGGQGTPKKQLPSEAELRLTRELQKALRDQTAKVDVEAKDKERMLALGERQGSLRKLLDELLQNASGGQTKMGPEPENKNILPEEVGQEESEQVELEKQLLDDNKASEKADKDVDRIGDRMARVRQRLALNGDPGKTTVKIEEKIIENLDDLIEMARRQQAKSKQQQKQQQQEVVQQNKQQQQQQEAQPQNEQATAQQQQQQAAQPAQKSTMPGGADVKTDLSQDIKQNMAEWGGLTKRQREAVVEGQTETVVEKYKSLVDDYYRTLAEKK